MRVIKNEGASRARCVANHEGSSHTASPEAETHSSVRRAATDPPATVVSCARSPPTSVDFYAKPRVSSTNRANQRWLLSTHLIFLRRPLSRRRSRWLQSWRCVRSVRSAGCPRRRTRRLRPLNRPGWHRPTRLRPQTQAPRPRWIIDVILCRSALPFEPFSFEALLWFRSAVSLWRSSPVRLLQTSWRTNRRSSVDAGLLKSFFFM